MNSKNYRNTMQFAVHVNKNGIVEVGKSAILQPKTNFKGGSIKWFDDSKLLRGGGVK